MHGHLVVAEWHKNKQPYAYITAKDKPSTQPQMRGGQIKRLKGQEGLGKGCGPQGKYKHHVTVA